MSNTNLDQLAENINEFVEVCKEHAISVEGPYGEFVETFAYGGADNSDIYKAVQNILDADGVERDAKDWTLDQIRAACSVEHHAGVGLTEHEVFSVSIGELEEHLPDALHNKIMALSSEDYKTLRQQVDGYMRDTFYGFIYVGMTYDRMVMVLDTDILLENKND